MKKIVFKKYKTKTIKLTGCAGTNRLECDAQQKKTVYKSLKK